jgi:tRNA-uridine 2-sulfurtransferase
MPVAVAMSGGMDSTAAALILKRQSHDVIGLHMRLHPGSDETWEHAQDAAGQVGVPIHKVELTEDFSRIVLRPFVDAYAQGRTPSPCPMCNRFVKMGLLFEKAHSMGCDRLATGHYARIVQTSDGPGLFRGLDKKKEQSYFLFMLTREMLARTVFPLGEYEKTQVRELLREAGVSVWETDESQELCFVTDRDYRYFVRERIPDTGPGPIKDLTGKTLGRHKGIIEYTIGQRRGLGLYGPKPHYVVHIDPDTNTVAVGTKEDTFLPNVVLTQMNFLRASLPEKGERFHIKVRSTAGPAWCTVNEVSEDDMELQFDEPQSAIAPGQAGVLYDGDRVVAGGWIAVRRLPERHDTEPRVPL